MRVIRRYLPDEQRNINGRGAGFDARRIVAEQAALSRHACIVLVERRLNVGKISFVLFTI